MQSLAIHKVNMAMLSVSPYIKSGCYFMAATSLMLADALNISASLVYMQHLTGQG